MAYIEWWNRTKPITMGERFGLNEISTARETLSPIKSHTAESVMPSQFDEISIEEMEDIKKQVKFGPQVKDGGRIGLGGGTSPKIIENRKRKLYFDLNRDGFMNLFEYLQSALAQNDYEGYYK